MKTEVFAKYFSYIFVPTTFTLWLFISVSFKFNEKVGLGIALSFLLTFILPIFIFVMLKKRGKIKDYDASVKEERTFLYIIGIFLCLIGYAFSYMFNLSNNFSILWIIYAINTLLLIIINKFWKISAHMIGISAPIAAFFYWDIMFYKILLIICIILAWARLKLKMHTISQIIAGFLFGFLLTYLQIKFFLG